MTFKVDTSDLSILSRAFKAAGSDVRTLSGKLTGEPSLTAEGDWGAAEAATSYVEARDFWVENLEQLVKSLECIGTKLSVAAELYEGTEKAVTVESD